MKKLFSKIKTPLVLLCVVVVLSFMTKYAIHLSQNESIYSNAKENYEIALAKADKSKIEEAIKSLATLGQYKDCKILILEWQNEFENIQTNETNYKVADELFNSGNFADAVNAFNNLGNYSDSIERAKESKFQNAKVLFENAQYSSAMMIFIELEDYNDSQTFAAECNERVNEASYLYAREVMNNGDYSEAVKLFGLLSGYKDSAKLQEQCERTMNLAKTVSAGGQHIAAITDNGKVLVAGDNNYTQSAVEDWEHIVSISCGETFLAGLQGNGTVVTTANFDLTSWNDIIAISTGYNYIVGLSIDGKVFATGHNGDGQCDAEKDWKDIVITSIATGWRHTVGLTEDEHIITTGLERHSLQKSDILGGEIKAIAAGGGEKDADTGHTIVLYKNGLVSAIGDNQFGQRDFGAEWQDSDIISIAADIWHSIGLKANHEVVVAGNYPSENNVDISDISKWNDIIAISAGSGIIVGLKATGSGDGAIVSVGYYSEFQEIAEAWVGIRIYPNWLDS